MHLDADRVLMKTLEKLIRFFFENLEISRTDQPLATWVDELNDSPSDPVATTVFLTLGTRLSAKACMAPGRNMIEMLFCIDF